MVKKKEFSLWLAVLVVSVFAIGGIVNAYSGGTPKVVVEGDYIEAFGQSLGGAINNVIVSFDEGIAVDGTSVIDGSGNFTGTVTGTLSTSEVISASGEGNKFGSTNTYNPIYIGAGDGCSYILFTASSTIASGATSTSFCN